MNTIQKNKKWLQVLCGAMMLNCTQAAATVVADPNANANLQPSIISTSNGLPQVNIQTPNNAGLSHNKYSQFDVDQKGAILNNATAASQTQLGGWIQGNPNLSNGAANLILNEVNSNNPSVLKGFIEVAGSRAAVVVANPSGITCDGCGFINVQAATLTTGIPVFSTGNLDGYQVQNGTISVQGKGLDASQTDYMSLIARSNDINAGIWAKDLTVTSGANKVSTEQIPAFAIDVSQLGGMYAGKIKLVATEEGVGVRNAGTISSSGDLVLNAAGKLENKAKIYGTKVVLAAKDIANEPTAVIAVREDLRLSAQNLTNQDHALIYSAKDIKIDGGLGKMQTLNNSSADIQAAGNLTIFANKLVNRNTNFSTKTIAHPDQEIQEWVISGSSNRYGAKDITLTGSPVSSLIVPGGVSDCWYRYDFKRSKISTELDTTDPALIVSGKDLHMDVDEIINDKSKMIAGGVITSSLSGDLKMIDGLGETVISDKGKAYYHYPIKSGRKLSTKHRLSQGLKETDYEPASEITSQSLGQVVYAENSSEAGDLSLANNQLFQQNPDPTARYLIETDPRFADYKTWLSSSYMLEQLGINVIGGPKLLGDGFYEQQSIQNQVIAQTGYRFLEGYSDDESQYKALMNNGLVEAKKLNLTLGIALSSEQVAALNSDIVWLVEKEIILADGTTQKVLEPKLYLSAKKAILNKHGSILAANSVDLNLHGNVLNQGSIASRTSLSLNAKNIENQGGTISGAELTLAANDDFNNIGGEIIGQNSIDISAGRDLNIETTTRTQTNAQAAQTNLDRIARVAVSGPDAKLKLSAKRDVNLTAASIQNLGTGETQITAGRDLNLGTVKTAKEHKLAFGAEHQRAEASTVDVGTLILSEGDINLSAGNNLNAKAAYVKTEAGTVLAKADANINIMSGENNRSLHERHYFREKGFLSSKKIHTDETYKSSEVVSSTFSGNKTQLQAGKDIKVQGSNIVSEQGTELIAKGDVNLLAAKEGTEYIGHNYTKKTGLISVGSTGYSIGKIEETTNTRSTDQVAVASMVGSTKGNVKIQAGEHYQQSGSNILAQTGDVHIKAKSVDVIADQHKSKSSQISHTKQFMYTNGRSHSWVTAAQTTKKMYVAGKDSGDSRYQALAAGTVAIIGTNVAFDALKTENPTKLTDVKTSAGFSKSQSRTAQEQNTSIVACSAIRAGRDVVIEASGAGKASTIKVQGSQIVAANNVELNAESDINLLAAANTNTQESTNSSSNFYLGASASKSGLTVDASAQTGKGKSSSQKTTWTNTNISAGNKVKLSSNGDTNLKGALVRADQIDVNVGGDLNIESLQDSSSSNKSQQNKSVAVSVPIGGGDFSGSASLNKSTLESKFKKVNEKSGLYAGDGGYQIKVAGNTDLKSGVISSSDQAVQDNKNILDTAGYSESTLEDVSYIKAKNTGFTADTSFAKQGNYGYLKGLFANAMNFNKIETNSATEQDLAKIERQAQARQEIQQEFYKETSKFADVSYKKSRLTKSEYYKLVCEGDLAACLADKSLMKRVPISKEEAKKLGGIISNHGIFNTLDDATISAFKQAAPSLNEKNPEAIVLLYVPIADSFCGELFGAFFEKHLAPTLGYSNRTIDHADLIQEQGQRKIHDIAHSNGTSEQRNTFKLLAERGYQNPNLKVTAIGSPLKAGDSIESAAKVTQAGNINFIYNKNDPVSVLIGKNEGSIGGSMKEIPKLLGSGSSAHSSYGMDTSSASKINSNETVTINGKDYFKSIEEKK